MKTIYQDLELQVPEDVYKPAEDTFFLADNLDVGKGERVLDLGTGCGLFSIIAAREGGKVVATDVSEQAIDCAKENAENQGFQDDIDFRTGYLFEPVKDENFDLIVFNPPYLPVPSEESLEAPLERAWDGGPNGRRVIDEFLEKVEDHLDPNGRFLFVQSSLSGVQETSEKLKKRGFRVKKKSKKFSFEKLYLFQVTFQN